MKNLDKITWLFVIIVFLSWGTSVFFDKLAAVKIGSRGWWLYFLSTLPSIIFFLILLFGGYRIFHFDKTGILWLLLAAITNTIALVFYYLVFTKTEASWAAPITALYPIWTAILALVFLKETISLYKIIGIFLAMAAIIFLSL